MVASGSLDAALGVLDEQGYEPHEHGNEIVLANCPFHALVDEQRDLVCGMNRDFLAVWPKRSATTCWPPGWRRRTATAASALTSNSAQ